MEDDGQDGEDGEAIEGGYCTYSYGLDGLGEVKGVGIGCLYDTLLSEAFWMVGKVKVFAKLIAKQLNRVYICR